MKQTPTVKSELNKLRHNQQFLAIAILLFASAIIWVGFGLFTSQKSTRVTSQQKTAAQPLSPTLDTAALDTIENKPFFSESELTSFTIYQLVAVEDSVFERAVPIGTDISTLESEETATESATTPLLEEDLTTPDTATASSQPTPTPTPTATESGATSAP